MRHTIPIGNWTMALADAIESAKDGDVIVVHNAAMKELAEGAYSRMFPSLWHPHHSLTFEIQPQKPVSERKQCKSPEKV